jgi:hypothetical protein
VFKELVMKRLICAALVIPAFVWVAAAAAAMPPPAETVDAPSKGEAQLAKVLAGREAGAPLRCIRSLGAGQPMRTIDGTAYVFGQGDVLYVQRTTRPQDISRRFALSIKRLETTSGVEICRTDVAETFERALGVPRASVIFKDFIPYTRTRRN